MWGLTQLLVRAARSFIHGVNTLFTKQFRGYSRRGAGPALRCVGVHLR